MIEALLNLGWFGPLILGALVGAGFNIAISSTRWHQLNQGASGSRPGIRNAVRHGDAAQDECNRGRGWGGMAISWPDRPTRSAKLVRNLPPNQTQAPPR